MVALAPRSSPISVCAPAEKPLVQATVGSSAKGKSISFGDAVRVIFMRSRRGRSSGREGEGQGVTGKVPTGN